MNKLNKHMKKAFSLLELTISILIVSIIVVVCVPMIMEQMKKTEEYAYFLGFKTVEKLGSQIVALGDPLEEDADIAFSKKDIDFNLGYSEKIAKNTETFVSKFMPAANAARTTLVSFPSYEYDLARICNGNQNVLKDYKDEAGNEFTPAEIASLGCPSMYHNNNSVKMRFGCKNGTYASVATLATTEDEPDEFCEHVFNDCKTKFPGFTPKKEYKTVISNQADNMHRYFQCIIYLEDDTTVPTGASGTQTIGAVATHALADCEGYGYLNTTGTTLAGCSCGGVTPVNAVNNPSVCCPTPATGNVAYVNKDGICVAQTNSDGSIENGCKIWAFDEINGRCCPKNSYYSRTIGHCACAQGYQPDNPDNLTACTEITETDCPSGYHHPIEGDKTCVVNSPIVKAKRFCELIRENYNVTEHSCGDKSGEQPFVVDKTYDDGSEPVEYYKELFEAIAPEGTQYLSVKAIEGAFNNVKPNIVFSNGLKLWILGDKVASIAGLSFNPTDYTPEINACVDRKVYTEAECNAKGATHAFCKSGNHCFTIEQGGSIPLQDATSCCPTQDYREIQKHYIGNTYVKDPRVYAINGFTVFVDVTGDKDSDQGGGTLWKDVFPFYVSANGTVYPGYPLNASKADVSIYQGGNSSALSSDVYYYDIVEAKDSDGNVIGRMRQKQVVYSSIPYSRAQCFALQISPFTPYCQNLGTKFREAKGESSIDKFIYSDENPCSKHRCYVHVKNKIKFL